jgi:anti-sigma factor RsiW
MDVENCRHLIEQLLSSYVDGELDAHTSQHLELHMQMCPPCAAFLRTFLATKRCTRTETVTAMPEECEASLWSFLSREVGVTIEAVEIEAHDCGDHGKKSKA